MIIIWKYTFSWLITVKYFMTHIANCVGFIPLTSDHFHQEVGWDLASLLLKQRDSWPHPDLEPVLDLDLIRNLVPYPDWRWDSKSSVTFGEASQREIERLNMIQGWIKSIFRSLLEERETGPRTSWFCYRQLTMSNW